MAARHTVVFALFCVLAAAGVAVGVLYRPERTPEERIPFRPSDAAPEGIARPRPQEAAGRRWRKAAFRPMASIANVGVARLIMPLHVRIDGDGCLYILDWSERCVKKFDQGGTFLMRFGSGEGGSPGEFVNLSDFDVDADGSLWTCDPVNGVITVFNRDGTVRTALRPDRAPHRIALLQNEICAVMSAPIGNRMFRLYGSGGDVITEFGNLMEQQGRLGTPLDGRIVATGTGGFAYAAYRAGVFAVTTDTGDSIAVYRETIDHRALPDVLVSRYGNTEYARTDPDAAIATRSLSCVDGELHLLLGGNVGPHTAVVDVYEARGGGYRYSYDLPVDASVVCVSRTRLVAVSDTVVTLWERIEGSSHR